MDVLHLRSASEGLPSTNRISFKLKLSILNTFLNSEQADSWKDEVFVQRQRYRNSIACIHGLLSSFSFSCRFQGYLQIENSFRVIVQVCERDILKESEQLVWPQLTLTENLSYQFRRQDSGS